MNGKETPRQLLDLGLALELLKQAILDPAPYMLAYDETNDDYVTVPIEESDQYLLQLIDFVYNLALNNGVQLSSVGSIVTVCERIISSGHRGLENGQVIIDGAETLFTIKSIYSWNELLRRLDIRDSEH